MVACFELVQQCQIISAITWNLEWKVQGLDSCLPNRIAKSINREIHIFLTHNSSTACSTGLSIRWGDHLAGLFSKRMEQMKGTWACRHEFSCQYSISHTFLCSLRCLEEHICIWRNRFRMLLNTRFALSASCTSPCTTLHNLHETTSLILITKFILSIKDVFKLKQK